jgi:hypothetical protein
MTPHERQARADRAKAAMDEFLAPAFDHVEAEWYEKLVNTAGSEDPRTVEKIQRITAAVKAIRVVRAQIAAVIADGVAVEADMLHTAQIARMSPHKRSVVGV